MPVKNALVVDDSKSARMMLQRLLTRMNVESEAVESAEAALLFLDKTQPDVIFMDHMMPGMNGLEATQLIKNNPKTATIPTIMYTSKEGDEYFDMAKSHGAEGVLAKPANQEAVMAVIQSLDEPAANDEPVINLNPGSENEAAEQSNIPLIEIDKLIQKHLKLALTQAKGEMAAGLDSATQQLQNAQAHELKLIERNWQQQYEGLQQDVQQSLQPKTLFQQTRGLNQKLATLVSEKAVKAACSELLDQTHSNLNDTAASLSTEIQQLQQELQQEIQRTRKRATTSGIIFGLISGAATAATLQFLL